MIRSKILLFLSLCLCTTIGYGADYGFYIKNAEVVLSKQGEYVLNADIDYQFSPRADDALKHGVPLTLVVKIRLNRYRRFIWNKTVFSKNMVYRLSYHALRERYRVSDENQGGYQYFVSLRSAVETMGQIRNLPVLLAGDIEAETKYDAKLKVFLDIESLPLPLRSIAYLIPQWHISSGWYQWPLDVLNHP